MQKRLPQPVISVNKKIQITENNFQEKSNSFKKGKKKLLRSFPRALIVTKLNQKFYTKILHQQVLVRFTPTGQAYSLLLE